VPDLDAARVTSWSAGTGSLGVVLLVGRGIEPGQRFDQGGALGVITRLAAQHVERQPVAMAEHLGLAGLGQDE